VKLKFSLGGSRIQKRHLALNLQVTFSFSSSMAPCVIPFSLKGPGGLKV
jgi:hypothetical protein